MSTVGSSETWLRASRPRRSEPMQELQEGERRAGPVRWPGLVLLLAFVAGSSLWVLWSDAGLVNAVAELVREVEGQWQALLAEDPKWLQLSLLLALGTSLLASAVLLVVKVEPMLAARAARQRVAARYSLEEHSRRRYFQGIPHPLRPLPLTSALARAEVCREDGEPDWARSRLISLRGMLLEGRDRHRQWLGEYTEVEAERLAAWKQRALCRLGGSEFAKVSEGTEGSEVSATGASEARRSLDAELRRVEEALASRLVIGHRVLARAATGNRRPELAWAASEMGSLLGLAAAYEQGFPQLEILRRRVAVQRTLVSRDEQDRSPEALATAPGIHRCLHEIREQWLAAPGPISVAGRKAGETVAVPLGLYLVPDLPDLEEAPALFAAADLALARGFDVGHRIWGRLGRLAELGESVVGLDPLSPSL